MSVEAAVGEVVRRYRVEEALGVLLDTLAGDPPAAFNLLPPIVGVQPTWDANVYYRSGRTLRAEGATAAAALLELLRTLEVQRGTGRDGGVA